MAMQQQSETNVETSVVELSEPLEYRELTPYEPQELPTIYPGADRSLLTHEQKLAVNAYEDRYREGTTETLDDLRKKMPGTHLGVTGIFMEDIEVQKIKDGVLIFDPDSGEPLMEEKVRTMVRTSSWRPTGGKIIENELYFSAQSPIVARFFQRLIDEYNFGRMGDFQCEVPVEVFNKLYNRTGHTGIGLKVVEEL